MTRIRGISKTTHTKVVCKPTLRPKRRNRDKLGATVGREGGKWQTSGGEPLNIPMGRVVSDQS